MFKPLHFLPDEPAGAIAEPPAEEEQAAPAEIAQPEEAVPPEVQEQVSPDAVSGEPEVEDEVSPEEVLGRILDEAQEVDPEVAKRLRARMGVPEPSEDIDARERALELKNSTAANTAAWQQAQQQAQPYTKEAMRGSLTNYVEGLDGGVRGAAQQFSNGAEGVTVDHIGIDVRGNVDALEGYIQQSNQAAAQLEYQRGQLIQFAALEADPSHSLLSADERQQYAWFKQQGNQLEAMRLQLRAEGRSAPEQIQKAARVTAEKDVKMLEWAERAGKTLGKAGKLSNGKSAPEKPDTSTKEWAEETPIEELVKARAAQRG